MTFLDMYAYVEEKMEMKSVTETKETELEETKETEETEIEENENLEMEEGEQ